jgi:hypothetical protein
MLSAAAVNRRERSSRLSRKAMNRRLIPARSFTPSAYAKTFDIGNVILLQTLSCQRAWAESATPCGDAEPVPALHLGSVFTRQRSWAESATPCGDAEQVPALHPGKVFTRQISAASRNGLACELQVRNPENPQKPEKNPGFLGSGGWPFFCFQSVVRFVSYISNFFAIPLPVRFVSLISACLAAFELVCCPVTVLLSMGAGRWGLRAVVFGVDVSGFRLLGSGV